MEKKSKKTLPTKIEVAAPLNPKYGKGIFRRRIRLTKGEGFVLGELEDNSHAFKSTLYHDDHKVTDVQGEAIRYPMSTCPGAIEPLRKIIGMTLGQAAGELANKLKPRSQCTHLFDLTVLAYRHLQRDAAQCTYDIQMNDEDGAEQVLQVYREGVSVLEWTVKQWRIVAPEFLAGNTISQGFSKWLETVWSGNEQQKEYAWLAQKGYLVSQARMFDINKLGGTREFVNPSMVGICHTYSEEQIEHAVHSHDSFIDFTDTPEQLLRFE